MAVFLLFTVWCPLEIPWMLLHVWNNKSNNTQLLRTGFWEAADLGKVKTKWSGDLRQTFEIGGFKPAFRIAILEIPKQCLVNFAFLGLRANSSKVKVPATSENPHLMQTVSRKLLLVDVLLKRAEQSGCRREHLRISLLQAPNRPISDMCWAKFIAVGLCCFF